MVAPTCDPSLEVSLGYQRLLRQTVQVEPDFSSSLEHSRTSVSPCVMLWTYKGRAYTYGVCLVDRVLPIVTMQVHALGPGLWTEGNLLACPGDNDSCTSLCVLPG